MGYLVESDPFGPYREWEVPASDHRYVVGIDTAGGKLGQDRSAAVVVDAVTGNHVATWAGHLEPAEFGDVCTAIGERWSGKEATAFAVVEVNSWGLVVLERMRANGYVTFYCRRDFDRLEGEFKSQLGFTTSGRTRPVIIGRGKNALATEAEQMPDADVLHEMQTFVTILNQSGTATKEEHLPGCHDDVLFAWLLAREGVDHLRQAGEVETSMVQREPPKQSLLWQRIMRDRARLGGEVEEEDEEEDMNLWDHETDIVFEGF